MDSIDVLQKQLAERIAALDAQRKEEAERFNKEVAERNALAEIERQERLAAFQKAEEQRAAKKKAEAEAEQKRTQEETRLRKQLESDLAAADEAKRLQQEKLEWLRNEIAKQEFVEEQHRKAIQNAQVAVVVPEDVDPTAIDVENPVAPLNKLAPGEAVDGTDGKTPDSPLMSVHLKHILRQATRSY